MDIDEVLINLKVLEQLQVNQKLISRGPYLNIEFDSIVVNGSADGKTR